MMLFFSKIFSSFIAVSILFCFCIKSGISAEEKTGDPTGNADKWDRMIDEYTSESLLEKRKRKDTEENRYSTRLLSLNPGISFSHITSSVRRNDYTSLRTHYPFFQPNLALDIKSKEFRISENFGFLILNQSMFYRLNNQETDPIPDNVSVNNFGQMNFINSDLKNRTNRQNLGTEVRGFYSFVFPVIFYGTPESDGFKFGAGIGRGIEKEEGEMFIKNRYQPLLAFANIDSAGHFNSRQYLNDFALYNLASGITDPLTAAASFAYAQNGDRNILIAALAAGHYNGAKIDMLTFTVLTNSGVSPAEAVLASFRPKTKV
ncbi:MAG TPA: hypothetical protein PKK05_28285, partial [Leptospiraceae bacterium]|nr:hypothetical protein [Leptospiraceae bacterium]